jgi:hypothetical protein
MDLFRPASLIWDLYQQHQIHEVQEATDLVESDVDSLRRKLDGLQRRNDTLALACQAMWELLRSQANSSDELMVRKMEEIDLRDGQADGRISPPPLECPRCARKNNAVRFGCLYCGTKLSEIAREKGVLPAA